MSATKIHPCTECGCEQDEGRECLWTGDWLCMRNQRDAALAREEQLRKLVEDMCASVRNGGVDTHDARAWLAANPRRT